MRWVTTIQVVGGIRRRAAAGAFLATLAAAGCDGAAPPPNTVLTDFPPPLTNQATAAIAFTAEGREGAGFRCRVDGADAAPCESPLGLGPLADGRHRIAVRAVGAGGRADPTPATAAWTVDTAAPTTELRDTPPALSPKTTATITFAAEASAAVECMADGGSWTPCTSPLRLTNLGRGEHRAAVRSTDRAGNREATPPSTTWTVDALPETTWLEVPADPNTEGVARFRFRGSDDGNVAAFECAADGGPFAACASPWTVTGLTVGAHVAAVRAIDDRGQADPTPAAYGWTVAGPDTRLLYAPSAPTPLTAAVFQLTSDAAGVAEFACSLDGGESVCGATVTFTTLDPGHHGASFAARDAGGSQDATPVEHGWTIQPPTPTSWSTVSVGGEHACGLAAGALFCWGANAAGQLGLGGGGSATAPARVGAAADWTAVAAGRNHTCALRNGGNLYCWGDNSHGQIGTGGVGPAVTVPAWISPATTFTAVAAGAWHSCAVAAGGGAWCWGRNSVGQLGDGTLTLRAAPVSVATALTFPTVSAGAAHTCGVTDAGGLYCWGSNLAGQLGDGGGLNRSQPTAVSTTGWAAVEAGGEHTCAVAGNGSAWCWGAGEDGQLGTGTAASSTAPTPVTGGHGWISLAAGGTHTCGRDGAGRIWCWGGNLSGQLGVDRKPAGGGFGVGGVPSPVRTGFETPWSAVAGGAAGSCGIRGGSSPGSLWCWGEGAYLPAAAQPGSPFPAWIP